eukprot:jgi/Chlat1/2407/Chrsp17S02665
MQQTGAERLTSKRKLHARDENLPPEAAEAHLNGNGYPIGHPAAVDKRWATALSALRKNLALGNVFSDWDVFRAALRSHLRWDLQSDGFPSQLPAAPTARASHAEDALAKHTGGTVVGRKTEWTEAEQLQLVLARAQLGSCNWNKIAERVPGRTARELESYWNKTLSAIIWRERWQGKGRLLTAAASVLNADMAKIRQQAMHLQYVQRIDDIVQSKIELQHWEFDCCVCKQGGRLIACQYGQCNDATEPNVQPCWKAYHLECVGLSAEPSHLSMWTCPRHRCAIEGCVANEQEDTLSHCLYCPASWCAMHVPDEVALIRAYKPAGSSFVCTSCNDMVQSDPLQEAAHRTDVKKSVVPPSVHAIAARSTPAQDGALDPSTQPSLPKCRPAVAADNRTPIRQAAASSIEQDAKSPLYSNAVSLQVRTALQCIQPQATTLPQHSSLHVHPAANTSAAHTNTNNSTLVANTSRILTDDAHPSERPQSASAWRECTDAVQQVPGAVCDPNNAQTQPAAFCSTSPTTAYQQPQQPVQQLSTACAPVPPDPTTWQGWIEATRRMPTKAGSRIRNNVRKAIDCARQAGEEEVALQLAQTILPEVYKSNNATKSKGLALACLKAHEASTTPQVESKQAAQAHGQPQTSPATATTVECMCSTCWRNCTRS